MALHLSEAQQLLDVVNDAQFRIAFQAFLNSEREAHVSMLMAEIHREDGSEKKYSRLAGKIDVFETIFSELEHFADRMMKEAQ